MALRNFNLIAKFGCNINLTSIEIVVITQCALESDQTLFLGLAFTITTVSKYKTENNVRQKALPTDDDGEGHSGSYSDSLMDTIRHSSHVRSCQMVTTRA